ncbi:hypothetical protein C6370_20145 [Bacillus atrophaeus]|uniref:hypothetical protein n=1 Tax=Bacillus atrophaeus TaxID=1452 RepID=UPI000C059FFF|nr:hypothetical protein [Bacillus atrophaeus]ATO28927.1 hypothetical protein RA13_13705 [Bacillus atrophaeus]PSA89284.1 hypothetical protein C6370_20145 [Bacillus atrophaeus]
METLDAPIYEIKQESDWYKTEKKRREDINKFFDKFEETYGINKGFSFYHSEYFGVRAGTEAYDFFKDEVVKNPTKAGFYAFKKRSKYFTDIRSMLEQIEEVNPFKGHDVFGRNNITASQWVGDRWFFGVRDEKRVEGEEATPIDFKDYLKIILERLG